MTGAARGIGRAIALDLAAQGADLVVNYRPRADVAEEVTKARRRGSFTIFTVLMKKGKVFVSGVFFSGPPYRILEAWRDGKLQLVVSQQILEEYRRVGKTLAEHFPGVNLQPIIDLVKTNGEIFPNQALPESVCDDPEELLFDHLAKEIEPRREGFAILWKEEV